MNYADTDTLYTILDSADADGRIHIVSVERIRNRAEARELLEITFMEQPLLTLRLETVKKAISELDINLAQQGDRTVVSLNLAKLLQLPAADPAAELAEFKAMLDEMKAFYQARPTQNGQIQLCNERDNHRRVYGSITCRYADRELLSGLHDDIAVTQSLTARIDASPALSHWLRQVGLSLQKIGPWSWIFIREESLFGYGEGPQAKNRQESRLKNPPEPDTRKYRVLNID